MRWIRPVDRGMANSLPQGGSQPVWTTPRTGGSGFCVYQTRA